MSQQMMETNVFTCTMYAARVVQLKQSIFRDQESAYRYHTNVQYMELLITRNFYNFMPILKKYLFLVTICILKYGNYNKI